ncbi:unnamed protein product [Periconia digitata]|uniref:Uncharacterized protein n=1 Tax=Periconia digitata TaxID=1303443 RepID=A0A9W4U6K4_9PLEO|nr:unnamed protein product [Periconia digitata]
MQGPPSLPHPVSRLHHHPNSSLFHAGSNPNLRSHLTYPRACARSIPMLTRA